MADDDLAAALLELGAATLGESGAAPLPARIRAVWPGARVAAPAFPVRCTPGDNLAVHVAVTLAPPGSALMVDVGDVAERGYWGEVLTTAAEARCLAGLVIDGCVRDLAALAAHRFPVFAVSTALPGATKQSPGTAGTPTEVAGVRVAQEDWVVGDDDGVVVVPGARLQQVMAAGRARAAKEQTLFDELRTGATTVALLGLDPSPIEIESPPRNLRGSAQG